MDNKNMSTDCEDDDVEFQEMVSSLPREKHSFGVLLCLYQNFWCATKIMKSVVSFQKHFEARDSDVILTSYPKSGTTWLKALAHTIVHRSHYSTLADSPLLTHGPHEVVRFLESDLYKNNSFPDLETGHSPNGPRIFSSHLPYASLPKSITDSGCRIVYVSRNPLDQLVSYWNFIPNVMTDKNQIKPLDDVVEMFCRGVQFFGPIWDHALGFWKASLERPDKVLFLKYEDMKADAAPYVKKLAEFLGVPFSVEEENEGVVEEIINLCSFKNLKDLEVNKKGKLDVGHGIPNNSFFRKGEVGDWTNYITPSVAERIKKIVDEKLAGSGLTFETFSPSNA